MTSLGCLVACGHSACIYLISVMCEDSETIEFAQDNKNEILSTMRILISNNSRFISNQLMVSSARWLCRHRSRLTHVWARSGRTTYPGGIISPLSPEGWCPRRSRVAVIPGLLPHVKPFLSSIQRNFKHLLPLTTEPWVPTRFGCGLRPSPPKRGLLVFDIAYF